VQANKRWNEWNGRVLRTRSKMREKERKKEWLFVTVHNCERPTDIRSGDMRRMLSQYDCSCCSSHFFSHFHLFPPHCLTLPTLARKSYSVTGSLLTSYVSYLYFSRPRTLLTLSTAFKFRRRGQFLRRSCSTAAWSRSKKSKKSKRSETDMYFAVAGDTATADTAPCGVLAIGVLDGRLRHRRNATR
jgi:hypothetical protein